MATTSPRTGRPPLPKDIVRTTTLNIRLQSAELQRAREHAAREGRSISNFVRHLYLMGLAQYEAELARNSTH